MAETSSGLKCFDTDGTKEDRSLGMGREGRLVDRRSSSVMFTTEAVATPAAATLARADILNFPDLTFGIDLWREIPPRLCSFLDAAKYGSENRTSIPSGDDSRLNN